MQFLRKYCPFLHAVQSLKLRVDTVFSHPAGQAFIPLSGIAPRVSNCSTYVKFWPIIYNSEHKNWTLLQVKFTGSSSCKYERKEKVFLRIVNRITSLSQHSTVNPDKAPPSHNAHRSLNRNFLLLVCPSSSSSIGTTTLSWVSACSTNVEHSQQEGFTECRFQRRV
jgi:hypothetical protein